MAAPVLQILPNKMRMSKTNQVESNRKWMAEHQKAFEEKGFEQRWRCLDLILFPFDTFLNLISCDICFIIHHYSIFLWIKQVNSNFFQKEFTQTFHNQFFTAGLSAYSECKCVKRSGIKG